MKTRLFIVGGFLGAGKTTLLQSISQIVQKQGKKVGLITNDQAEGLVDTYVLSTSGLQVKEIAGSCFCCDFDGLMDAALYLRDVGCDTIIAEPVGSCTDLSATLAQPIKSDYSNYFDLAPIIVLVDPTRFLDTFSSKTNTEQGSGYIYLKQLEEADYLVINKTDALPEATKVKLEQLLIERFSDYPVQWISALNRSGVKEMMESLTKDSHAGARIAKVDYDTYADGEALMGWYNAEFIVYHGNKALIPWADFNVQFLGLLQATFQYENIAIGHVKTFLKSGRSSLQANLTGTNNDLSVRGTPFSSQSASIIVNIRAESNPEFLKEIMDDIIDVLAEQNFHFKSQRLNHLTPGRPQPTHRYDEIIQ